MADTPNISPNPVASSQGQVIAQSDKLTIINQALVNTGNNTVNVFDDASSEWIVANSAYEQWVPLLYYRRNWNFATSFTKMTRAGDSPYPGMTDAFIKPADCMFLQNVWRMDEIERYDETVPPGVRPPEGMYPPKLPIKVLNDQVHTRAPYGAYCQYTPFPQGNDQWSLGFVAALRMKIEATLYRSLNEDLQAASAAEQYSEAILKEAVARDAQEAPGKVMFRSPLWETRWRRRIGGYWR
jgi:hypothetical protein